MVEASFKSCCLNYLKKSSLQKCKKGSMRNKFSAAGSPSGAGGRAEQREVVVVVMEFATFAL
jgi:hypothetical protein